MSMGREPQCYCTLAVVQASSPFFPRVHPGNATTPATSVQHRASMAICRDSSPGRTDPFNRKERGFMKTPVLHAASIALVVFLSYGLHGEPVLAGGCPAPSFAAQSAFGAATYPESVAVGDFNRDGKADLAVANVGSANVSVLLGNGDGTFQTALNYATGANPLSVAVGDFNGDGILDLAVANNGSADISVLLGNGDGTFRIAVNFSAGPYPESVAAGDFNGDGRPDLAVANLFSKTVSVLLGNGNGTFQAAAGYVVGTNPQSVAVGDFNGDHKPDLAVANFGSGNVSVLLGNGDGTFQTAVNYAAGADPYSVAVDDFNGDGTLDLVSANVNSADVSVLLNTCSLAGVGLAVARGINNVVISWPFPSTGYVLESNTSLNLTNWHSAVEIRTTNNGRWEVTASVLQQGCYFR